MFKRSSSKQIANRHPPVSRCAAASCDAKLLPSFTTITPVPCYAKTENKHLARWLFCRPVVKTSNSGKRRIWTETRGVAAMHLESNGILNKIETSAQQRFSNLSLSLLPCDGYHGHARITISLHHLSCQFENLMQFPFQYPFQMHLFNIYSNVFARSLLNSVHEIVFFQKCLLLRSHEKSPRWKHRATRWRRPISRLIKPTERRMIPVKASSACDKSWRFWVSQVEDEMSKGIWETPSVLKKWHLLEDIDIESWNWIDIHLESRIRNKFLKLHGHFNLPSNPKTRGVQVHPLMPSPREIGIE